MNYQQIAAAVYQRCNHFDPYLPPLSADLARAWGTLFEHHRLSPDDLLAGVDAVYDQHGSGYRPLPADIISAARALRQDRAMRQPLRAIEASTDVDSGDGRLAALLAAAKIGHHHNEPPPARGPRSVPCRHCGAEPGRRCTVRGSSDPLTRPPYYHPSRIEAAEGSADSPDPTPPPTPPPPITSASCPMCEGELITTAAAGRGICDHCWPVTNGHNTTHQQDKTA
jgi:hypothetical protein